jgi:hypothetical protein
MISYRSLGACTTMARVALALTSLTVATTTAHAQRDSLRKTTEGWIVALRMTSDAPSGALSRGSSIRTWIAGDRARMEADTGRMPTSVTGAYSVFNARDRTMAVVMPADSTVTISDMAAMGSGAFVIKTELSSVVRDSVEDLGAGDLILGHPTRRYRISKAYSITYTVREQSCVKRVASVGESLVATDIADSITFGTLLGAGVMSPGLGSSFKTLEALRAHDPKGLMLRSRGTLTESRDGGPTSTISTTIEVVELTHGPIADSVLDLPAAYTTRDMRDHVFVVPPDLMEKELTAHVPALLDQLCGVAKKS